MNDKIKSGLVSAAFAGLLAGTLLIGGCGESGKSEKNANGCSGPNGCGGKQHNEKNACKGTNGCGGKDAGKEKNSCSATNGCQGHEKKD